MSDKLTIGERVNTVVDNMPKKPDQKNATEKEDLSDILHDITETVKQSEDDSIDAVTDQIHAK